jgi:hypothetical protein
MKAKFNQIQWSGNLTALPPTPNEDARSSGTRMSFLAGANARAPNGA